MLRFDTREFPLEAPAGTPVPLQNAFEAVARALFEAAALLEDAPTTGALLRHQGTRLAQAQQLACVRYAAVELWLQAVTSDSAGSAFSAALNAIRWVNDAVGHLLLGCVPLEQAVAHLQNVPVFDPADLLQRMRRQISQAALPMLRSSRSRAPGDWPAEPANASQGMALTPDLATLAMSQGKTPKHAATQRRRDCKLEARDRWIYQACSRDTPYKTILTNLATRCQQKGWSKLSSVQGIRHAAHSYAKRHDLPMPRRRHDL